jgi:hypothetical protein
VNAPFLSSTNTYIRYVLTYIRYVLTNTYVPLYSYVRGVPACLIPGSAVPRIVSPELGATPKLAMRDEKNKENIPPVPATPKKKYRLPPVRVSGCNQSVRNEKLMATDADFDLSFMPTGRYKDPHPTLIDVWERTASGRLIAPVVSSPSFHAGLQERLAGERVVLELSMLQHALQQWPCPYCHVGKLSLGANVEGGLADQQRGLAHRYLMECDNEECEECVFLDTSSKVLTGKAGAPVHAVNVAAVLGSRVAGVRQEASVRCNGYRRHAGPRELRDDRGAC